MPKPINPAHRAPHSIRYHEHEWSQLEDLARACGQTPSRYIRELTLGYQPKAAPDAANREAIAQLARIGSNLNQLAKRFNQGHPLPEREILDCLNQVNSATRKLI